MIFQVTQFPIPIGAAKCGVLPFPKKEWLLPCRAQQRLPQMPVSVLIYSFPYASSQLKGNFSKYAMVPDYHTVLGKILENHADFLTRETGGEFVPFVDNSPLPEVSLAARAGLGFLGHHRLLIDPDYGSYLFLGTIVTNLPFKSTETEVKPCIGCGKCERACPGHALSDNKFQKEDCFSEITQNKRPPSPLQEKKMKHHRLVWGCDICQDVCPMNQNKKETTNPFFLDDIITTLTEETVTTTYQERAFGFRGPAVLLRNLKLLGKNQDTVPKDSHKKI